MMTLKKWHVALLVLLLAATSIASVAIYRRTMQYERALLNVIRRSLMDAAIAYSMAAERDDQEVRYWLLRGAVEQAERAADAIAHMASRSQGTKWLGAPRYLARGPLELHNLKDYSAKTAESDAMMQKHYDLIRRLSDSLYAHGGWDSFRAFSRVFGEFVGENLNSDAAIRALAYDVLSEDLRAQVWNRHEAVVEQYRAESDHVVTDLALEGQRNIKNWPTYRVTFQTTDEQGLAVYINRTDYHPLGIDPR